MKTKMMVPAIAGALLTILFLLVAAGCTRRVYLPVERYVLHTDSVHSVALRVDSLVVRDSIHIAARGDTIFRDHFRWRYRDRVVRDTIRIANATSRQIREPLPQPEPPKQSAAGNLLIRLKTILLRPLALLILLLLPLLLLRLRRRTPS